MKYGGRVLIKKYKVNTFIFTKKCMHILKTFSSITKFQMGFIFLFFKKLFVTETLVHELAMELIMFPNFCSYIGRLSIFTLYGLFSIVPHIWFDLRREVHINMQNVTRGVKFS